MLQPKRTKYRKTHKNKGAVKRGVTKKGASIAFGSFAIKSLDTAWVTARQIEAARIAVTRYMKRDGQIWIRIFPDKPLTKKPAEVRMGKGKGNPELWVATVLPGRILFEADGVPLEVAKEAMRLAASKLPVRTKFIVRRDYSA
jgi:large subunit ribosomal protein L16